ncbi:hypothetical protein IMG5_090470 [Ichthyophthirius multifiliis]|uniref:J domain-containing protein n=1 Tax=Ichthyophthirius multifiliis TaxID=5932 RepID=G0QR83_ICHMU|nr:hypothetical protein IMG5_090470 [Ichthyophthirius multifiliis]EGR32271.1 hypothetical protein IMG5_090470 [Ichthyophthirius multifiliis]|eukprot:XP_004035757.1 hypothetical protein IMG5_090470 [Ichthyophthirius multifiliis]
MPRNYYNDLQINRDATQEEIANSYRRLSLRYHPKFSKMDQTTTNYYFSLISEAYEVLSDQVRRAFYDQFGEEKLKQGFFHKGGYRFEKNPIEIFEKFYLENNPFAYVIDENGENGTGTLFGYHFQGQHCNKNHPPQDLETEADCTLNEFYNGCSKQIKYLKRVLQQDGRTTQDVECEKTIHIKPGFKDGTVLRFYKEGNQAAGYENSDLIIRLNEIDHQNFKRKQNDLIYVHKINLYECWNIQGINIITLDGRRLYVAIDEVVTPFAQQIVHGQGMPIYFDNYYESKKQNLLKNQQDKGNLIIQFDVQFPQNVSLDQVNNLKKLSAYCQ